MAGYSLIVHKWTIFLKEKAPTQILPRLVKEIYGYPLRL